MQGPPQDEPSEGLLALPVEILEVILLACEPEAFCALRATVKVLAILSRKKFDYFQNYLDMNSWEATRNYPPEVGEHVVKQYAMRFDMKHGDYIKYISSGKTPAPGQCTEAFNK